VNTCTKKLEKSDSKRVFKKLKGKRDVYRIKVGEVRAIHPS
jgi:hypothetical protein